MSNCCEVPCRAARKKSYPRANTGKVTYRAPYWLTSSSDFLFTLHTCHKETGEPRCLLNDSQPPRLISVVYYSFASLLPPLHLPLSINAHRFVCVRQRCQDPLDSVSLSQSRTRREREMVWSAWLILEESTCLQHWHKNVCFYITLGNIWLSVICETRYCLGSRLL